MITILNPPDLVQDPVCIVRTSDPADLWQGESRKIKGDFARIHIKTGEDWSLIRMMRHGIDYFAPCSGNGLMVKAELLKRYEA